MKRHFKTICSVFIIGLLPFAMANGQEKKTEQKIKIVTTDDSGTKIIFDTLINGNEMPESIKLKDGNVIFPGHGNEEKSSMPHWTSDDVTLTVTSNGKNKEHITKKITIVSSDSAKWMQKEDGGKFFVYTDSDLSEGINTGNQNIVSWSEKKEDRHGDKIIYIKEGKIADTDLDKTVDVWVSKDDSESQVEKTRFVIAKDGMVVTVEGNDEAKARELVKEIEKKLGINNEVAEKKKATKNNTKITEKR